MIAPAAPPGPERESPRSLAGGSGASSKDLDCGASQHEPRQDAVNERKGHQPFIPAWLDDAGVSPRAFRVGCHLWRRRNRLTGQCNPSAAAIGRACGLNRDTVWAALKELESTGLMLRSKRGFRSSNQYHLLIPSGGKIPLVESPQLAENLVPTGGNLRQPLAEELRHQGSPLKVQKEGDGTPPPGYSSGGSEEAWIERLVRVYPGVDVRGELRRAQRKRPDGVERGWFERHWLPRVTPRVERTAAKPKHAPECGHVDPEFLRAWLIAHEPPEDTWHGQWQYALNGAALGSEAVQRLPQSVQTRFLADMQAAKVADFRAAARACA